MNIKITYNWLLDYLETDADPYEIGKFLSLSGPSVERIDKIDDDYVFDIEITSNRIDMASVFGIAQEAQAILPQFGKKAKLKFNPLTKYTFDNLHAEPVPHEKLDITIENHDLCPRFTAMVFSNVQIKPSPELIQKRLKLVDIKSINNVIDISNYLMVSLGQPTHMFDFDQIKDKKMILRESKKGEKLVTLDRKEIILPGGDIVIEDGSGRLIDLCGIMGGENSSITNNTTNVLFFVQTYNKRKIRKTSMLTGQRTMAATYFEKGLDPERVEPTFVYGVDLQNEMTGGIAHSELIDIYPNRAESTHVEVSLDTIQSLMGVEIEDHKVKDILERLGFDVKEHHNEKGSSFKVIVPSFRKEDVQIKQDIVEEVARVYGYYNLPNNISPMVYIPQPKETERLFALQQKVKYLLKHLGLHEVMNYSMISGELIDKMGLTRADHLKLANTISTEIEYMRLSLIPSLIQNQKENMGKRDPLKIFEIAKIYPQRKNELPDEQYKLGITVDTDFFDLKGIIETLFDELNIDSVSYIKGENTQYAKNTQAAIIDKKTNEVVGMFGRLNGTLTQNFELHKNVFAAEIDFSYLLSHYKVVDTYRESLQYAVVKLDVNIVQKPGTTFDDVKKKAIFSSTMLQDIEFVNLYNNTMTLRMYFSSAERNITEEEAKSELATILKNLA